MQEDFSWKSSKLCPYAGESRSCNHILLGLHPGNQLYSLGLSLLFFNASASSSHAKVSQGGGHHLCPLKLALRWSWVRRILHRHSCPCGHLLFLNLLSHHLLFWCSVPNSL